MSKYVIKADLPEVLSGPYGTLEIDGEAFDISGVWSHPQRWLDRGHAFLAIAEYLEANKPKLPTEPGSVILATKIKGWDDHMPASGLYLVLRENWVWGTFEGDLGWSEDWRIEEWVPVKLVPQIEVTK